MLDTNVDKYPTFKTVYTVGGTEYERFDKGMAAANVAIYQLREIYGEMFTLVSKTMQKVSR